LVGPVADEAGRRPGRALPGQEGPVQPEPAGGAGPAGGAERPARRRRRAAPDVPAPRPAASRPAEGAARRAPARPPRDFRQGGRRVRLRPGLPWPVAGLPQRGRENPGRNDSPTARLATASSTARTLAQLPTRTAGTRSTPAAHTSPLRQRSASPRVYSLPR